MKVFLLGADYDAKGNDRHRSLHPVVEEDAEWLTTWTFGGDAKAEGWGPAPRPVEILDPGRKPPDVVRLGGWGAFALTDNAARAIGQLLRPVSELLPVSTADGELFHVVNVVPLTDALDAARTLGRRNSAGGFSFVQRYVFDPSRVPRRTLFKVRERPYNVFVLQGPVPPENDFKQRAEALGFRGVTFQEVWNDEGVPVPDLEEFERMW